ncbi:MAG: TraR/DksA C4-type zinc finger protein, partial [Akkermansiaceae bacterium]|nr:TraR/DksA C4-type zinc finger protein [Akkermansiaceae bacterium]
KKAAPPKKVVKKAVKKATSVKVMKKAAPPKKVVKKAVKKATSVKVAKKAAPKKKAPAKATKKVAPAKKVIKKAVTKAAPPVKPAKKKAVVKKKPTARKSSLIGTPPPPAPIKPRFVPPKAATIRKPSATGGSHSASFIEKQRQRLLDLRDSLVDSMTGMTRDTIRNAPEGSEASGSGEHQGDAGSDAYDRDFALSILANEQDALYEVEQALFRITKGAYGNCEMCSHKIPATRLEAIPFARLTVEEQANWEKEYGNRRFRPSDEVGFSGGVSQQGGDSLTVSLDGDDD